MNRPIRRRNLEVLAADLGADLAILLASPPKHKPWTPPMAIAESAALVAKKARTDPPKPSVASTAKTAKSTPQRTEWTPVARTKGKRTADTTVKISPRTWETKGFYGALANSMKLKITKTTSVVDSSP
ncbi:hypothetical protein H310_07839 [Aphanomyces invadans]|uniref:Uncharacterized protein n=1 Tax=Aphanomyces invadans TaxID=157072 RepID=A0A024U0J7_9STRA|nr:hypothetical protein H310_07839 [Aphanomyces invadans]ETV99793.1 hypothetical protein H310_07839 [Aphanomyces invadans]|eukprot:XP_008871569.1 hypothetical protein H310_07839 [Aphanomyces invadans]